MQSTLFHKIVEALTWNIQDENIPLYITTLKRQTVALQMCQIWGIAKYFKGIYGLNSRSYQQSQIIIHYALSINDLQETVIVEIQITDHKVKGIKQVCEHKKEKKKNHNGPVTEGGFWMPTVLAIIFTLISL